MSPSLQWLAPAPLWDAFRAEAERTAFRRPALLRFATDQYMEEVQRLLAAAPARLGEHLAAAESWRAPAAGLAAATSTGALKLYQPAQARFYLIGAALTCRLPGLPDHQVKAAQGEDVGFVVRRLESLADGDVSDPRTRREYAWVEGEPPAWVPAPEGDLVDGEERRPLFALLHGGDGTRRRTFAALVPVGKRQSYVTARKSTPSATAGPTADPRLVDLQRRVTDPWYDLTRWFATQQDGQAVVDTVERTSALILLDLADWLATSLPDVWQALASGARPTDGAARALYDALRTMVTDHATSGSIPLADAIRAAKRVERDLEQATLVDAGAPPLPAGYPHVRLTDAPAAALVQKEDGDLRLRALVRATLPPSPAAAAETPPPSLTADPVSPRGDDWFVIRCVYRRPQCGPGAAPVMSEPTAPFQMASFFDPDAPARPVQVALPIDTTPAALRKYDKGVAFVLSDELAKQMARVKGLKQLMDGDLGPAVGIGMICSFSIPIITICAMIVLMIFVQLMNIVFWWLPFLKICFPLPQLHAKEGGS